MGKNLLIAGGAGFIGCNFIRYVLDRHKDWSVTVIDDFSFSRPLNLKDVIDRIKLVELDISEYDNLEKLVESQDFVVNFVAQTHVDRSIHDSRPFIISEVLGTDNLLRAVRKSNVARYLQVSTDEVYGEITDGSFKPNDPVNPRNPYSAAKASADMLVRASWYTYGTPVLITRCSNNFGPYQHTEKFLPKIITRAIMHEKIPIYGDGNQIRDWIYVTDHCSAILTVLERGTIGEIYHVATGNELRNKEIASLVLSYLGKDSKLLERVEDRLGHDKRYSLDTTSTRNLGWKPSVKFEDGLKSTVSWYVENQEWWKTLPA